MNKMKVLQVNKLYYPETGGIEKTLQQISEGLNADPEIDLKVLVCQKKGSGKTERVNGVLVHRSASLGVLASVPISLSFCANLRKLVQQQDIIQFHLPFPLGDLGCLLSGYQGKVVAFWHSDVVKQKRWMVLYRPIMERFLKRADVILVGAEGIMKGSQYLKPYQDKCRVVPFAVTDEILQAGGEFLKHHDGSAEKENFHFLFIGRLVYYKGCSVLLDAFAQLYRQESRARLDIVGDGVLQDDLHSQADELGIADGVHFMGHVDDDTLRHTMETADVFVLPSIERSEAFALVQLEAMSYGIPVINTNLPSGVPEVSVHGQTGLTVEPGDSGELAEAMRWMIQHPEERRKMGAAARERVESHYTQEQMIHNLKSIYSELLGQAE